MSRYSLPFRWSHRLLVPCPDFVAELDPLGNGFCFGLKNSRLIAQVLLQKKKIAQVLLHKLLENTCFCLFLQPVTPQTSILVETVTAGIHAMNNTLYFLRPLPFSFPTSLIPSSYTWFYCNPPGESARQQPREHTGQDQVKESQINLNKYYRFFFFSFFRLGG